MDLNPLNTDNSASTSLPESNSHSKYISISEHGQFMDNLEAQLLSACKEDFVLKDTEVVSLLNCCPKYSNNNHRQRRFNDQIAAHLQAKVDHHHGRALLLKIIFLDGQTTEAIVRPSDSLAELKRSIERSIELRVLQLKEEKKNTSKQTINWAHVWRKYDLLVDRKQRIQMNSEPVDSKNKPETVISLLALGPLSQVTTIDNHSTVEFVHRRRNN